MPTVIYIEKYLTGAVLREMQKTPILIRIPIRDRILRFQGVTAYLASSPQPIYAKDAIGWTSPPSIPGIEILDEIRNAIAFEVVDSGGIEFKLSQGRRGVVTPVLEWYNERIS